MKYESVYRGVLPVAFVMTGCYSQSAQDQSPSSGPIGKAPNILLIMSDQHNADVLGFRGHPDVRTPNLDRMAAEGVSFSRAYCANGISVASRTSLFTGYYPRTTGFLNNSNVSKKSTVLQQSVPLQLCLQQNGYRTYAFGKRHLFGNADLGWDVHFSHRAEESPQDNYVMWIAEQGFAAEFARDWAAETDAEMGTRLSALGENYTMEAYTALHTMEMLRDYASSDQAAPFFCLASFYRPHQPYTPLAKYWNGYDRSAWGEGTRLGSSIVMPPTLRQPADELPKLLRNQRANLNNPWCLGRAAEDEQLYRNYISAYYALVEEVDYWIGQIFEVLEQTGLDENTIVVYCSDHGDFVGHHGMIEKAAAGHNIYEETLRVPLIFRWKNHLPAGVDRSGLISLVDLYPTLLDLAGVRSPSLRYPLQGISYKEHLLSGGPSPRSYVVSENWSQAAVISDRYKLGVWLEPPAVYAANDYRDFGNMLFDRTSDRYETRNLISDPRYADQVVSLMLDYEMFKARTDDIGKQEVVVW